MRRKKKLGAFTLERLTYTKKDESQHAKPEVRRRRLVEGDLFRCDVYTERLRDAAWMTQRGAARNFSAPFVELRLRSWPFSPFEPILFCATTSSFMAM